MFLLHSFTQEQSTVNRQANANTHALHNKLAHANPHKHAHKTFMKHKHSHPSTQIHTSLSVNSSCRLSHTLYGKILHQPKITMTLKDHPGVRLMVGGTERSM